MELATLSELGGDLGQNSIVYVIFLLSFVSGVSIVGDLHFNR